VRAPRGLRHALAIQPIAGHAGRSLRFGTERWRSPHPRPLTRILRTAEADEVRDVANQTRGRAGRSRAKGNVSNAVIAEESDDRRAARRRDQAVVGAVPPLALVISPSDPAFGGSWSGGTQVETPLAEAHDVREHGRGVVSPGERSSRRPPVLVIDVAVVFESTVEHHDVDGQA